MHLPELNRLNNASVVLRPRTLERSAKTHAAHSPTTAELSKVRSMHRKWMKAAVTHHGSPAAIALQSDVATAVARALTQFGSPA